MTEQFKIRWSDLGLPTKPCEMDYIGNWVIVTETDIERAKGNPDAVFTALLSRVLSGGVRRYILGPVEVKPPPEGTDGGGGIRSQRAPLSERTGSHG